jgi:hypothetical protein
MNLPTVIERIVCTVTYDTDPDLSYLEQFDVNDPDAELRRCARLDRLRLRAYQRGDWHCIGLAARARLSSPAGATWIDTGGLWGIESDSDPAYFEQVWDDELAELREMLLAIGATTDETDAVPVTYDQHAELLRDAS